MWIVMTSCAHMPSSCKGTYRRVALVKLSDEYAKQKLLPKMISEHARGVVRVKDRGNHSVGKTEKCAFARAVKEAEREALVLNTVGYVVGTDGKRSY